VSSNAVFFWAVVVSPPTQVLLLKAPGLFEPFFIARAPTSSFSCLDSFLAGSPPKSTRAGFGWAAAKPASPTSKVSQSNAVWRRRHALDSAPAFCPSPLYSISIRIIISIITRHFRPSVDEIQRELNTIAIPGESGLPSSNRFSFSTSSRRESLGTSGTGFYGPMKDDLPSDAAPLSKFFDHLL